MDFPDPVDYIEKKKEKYRWILGSCLWSKQAVEHHREGDTNNI